MAAVADLLRPPPGRRHRGDERAHGAAAVAVDLDAVLGQLLERADVGEAPGAATGEDDPERPPDEPAREPRGARVARLGGREPVEGARRDGVDQAGHDAAAGRPEHDEVGRRGRCAGERRVGGRDEEQPVGLAGAEVAPRAGAELVDEQDVRGLVLGALDGAGPRGVGAEDLDRAVPLERVRERPCDALDGHVAAEPAEREERRAGRWGAQAAARLEQGRELARDGRGEVGVALDHLVEALARQPQQRRVADRLD